MKNRFRRTGLAALGVILLGLAGCEGETPASGSQAIAPPDHLEKQRVKLEQMKAMMRSSQPTKVKSRR